MVTLGIVRKKRIRRSATLKTLEAGAAKILKGERQIVGAGPSLYLVPSMSTDGYREVRHENGRWICDCPYFMARHANCSHTCAVRMMAKMRDMADRTIKTTYVGVPNMVGSWTNSGAKEGSWTNSDKWELF